jgi:chromosome segregation ATPase
MTRGADVRSVDALREFLAGMVTYRSDAAEAVSAANQEVNRGIAWVQEQMGRWQRAIRDLEQEVTQAKVELAARKIPGFDGREPDTTLQERNLRRARARLEHAEDKVRTCKSWLSRLPKLIEETYTAPSHRLQTMLDGDVAAGLALLARQVEALEKYAGLRRDFGAVPLPKLPEVGKDGPS